MKKRVILLVVVILAVCVAFTVGCGNRTPATASASSSRGIGTRSSVASTPVVTASPTVDAVLEAATRRADALDPHAVKVLDTAMSVSTAHTKQMPIGLRAQQGRVIAFKGDFPEAGFPGADGTTHEPFVFFTYQADGQLTGWAFVDVETAAKWGVH